MSPTIAWRGDEALAAGGRGGSRIPTATGLVLPASRVHYHLLLAGAPETLDRFTAWLEPRLTPDYELQGVEQARPELRAALSRAALHRRRYWW